ncbi:hypothetical protein DID78_05370 [Candidatus Marinamargulisbacteria bacterium SCGC AG-343-D04]|nr:hypothetical protein DID78_05370 [Candidatus Marinamargulisbacteria bacterium SCGC AG-343-D04]
MVAPVAAKVIADRNSRGAPNQNRSGFSFQGSTSPFQRPLSQWQTVGNIGNNVSIEYAPTNELPVRNSRPSTPPPRVPDGASIIDN